MAGTKFKLREIFRFSLLLCFVFVVGIVVDADSDSSDLGQSQTPNPNPVESDGSELSSLFRRIAQLEQRNQEYEKLIGEMKVLKEQFKSLETSQETCDAQVKSLSEKLSGFETKISEDGGLWLLTPPVRGPPGKPGVKGEIGQDGRKGESGRNGGHGVPGSIGPKGDSGQIGPDGRPGQKGAAGEKGERGLSALPSSCSVAMEILPTPLSKKQRIYPHGNGTSLEVLCDFETDGGGWTIIQKRTSGPKEEFKQNWNEYQNGFGSLDGNFWLGLENIHALTKNGDQELRIELEDFEGNRKYAKYSNFSISDASDFYRLTLAGFSGTANDSMASHRSNNGMRFTSKDKDNDNYPDYNCAEAFSGGGWWFAIDFGNYCGGSNLNGLYFEKGEADPYSQGVYWKSWKGSRYSLAKSEMKIRPRK